MAEKEKRKPERISDLPLLQMVSLLTMKLLSSVTTKCITWFSVLTDVRKFMTDSEWIMPVREAMILYSQNSSDLLRNAVTGIII